MRRIIGILGLLVLSSSLAWAGTSGMVGTWELNGRVFMDSPQGSGSYSFTNVRLEVGYEESPGKYAQWSRQDWQVLHDVLSCMDTGRDPSPFVDQGMPVPYWQLLPDSNIGVTYSTVMPTGETITFDSDPQPEGHDLALTLFTGPANDFDHCVWLNFDFQPGFARANVVGSVKDRNNGQDNLFMNLEATASKIK